MTPEEKLFLKFEKSRFLFIGFNPPELKLMKAWLHGKHLTNITDVKDAKAAWSKLELSLFHFILIKADQEENDQLLDKMVDSHRFEHTPILVFSRAPEVYAHSYAKRDAVGRYCKLPVNLGEVEKFVVALMQAGKVEKSQIGQAAGTMNHYHRGCKALEEGRLDAAKEEFRLTLKDDPKFLDGYLKMGETLIEKDDFDTAIRVLDRANEYFPGNARVFFLIGRANFGKGERQKAQEAFDKALTLEPNNVRMIMDIGNMFLAENLIDEALRYFNMARDKSPEFLSVYNRIGIALSRAGRFEEAEATYNQALELDKDDPGIHFNIGMMWHRRQDKAKATECFKKCLELDSGMKVAREMLEKI